jgi:Family of unknown function (DUF5681)
MRAKPAAFIEEQNVIDSPQNRRSSGEQKQLRNGADPSIGKATQFKPGQSGNPGGRPKNDVAKQIAQAIFENNPDEIYKAFRKALLRGNAYTFKELAERAYGKIKESREHTGAEGAPLEVTVMFVKANNGHAND